MKQDGKFSKFINGKGFYAALGICMIAIGISAWSAMSSSNTPPKTIQNSSKITDSTPRISSEVTVGEAQKNVPAESSDTVSVTGASSASEVTAPVAKYFVYPVTGEVLKPFNDSELQYSLTYNDMRLHTGMDIKADAGTAVKSAGDGTVIFAGKDARLGYTVKIDHGNGITGVYAGLTDAIAVKKGDAVIAGANLGALGTVTEECVDAPHLHLEFLEKGKAVDPLSLLTNQ